MARNLSSLIVFLCRFAWSNLLDALLSLLLSGCVTITNVEDVKIPSDSNRKLCSVEVYLHKRGGDNPKDISSTSMGESIRKDICTSRVAENLKTNEKIIEDQDVTIKVDLHMVRDLSRYSGGGFGAIIVIPATEYGEYSVVWQVLDGSGQQLTERREAAEYKQIKHILLFPFGLYDLMFGGNVYKKINRRIIANESARSKESTAP